MRFLCQEGEVVKEIYGELDPDFFPDPLCTILPTRPLTDLRKPVDLFDFLHALADSFDCSLICPRIPTRRLSTLWFSIVDVSVNLASYSLASNLPSTKDEVIVRRHYMS